MKKVILIVFSCLALLTVFSCKKQQQSQGRTVVLTATIQGSEGPAGAPLKAHVSDDGSFAWDLYDEIGVWTTDGKFTKFTLKSGASSATAEFQATLEAGVEVADPSVAVFPYRSAHSYDPSTHVLVFNQPNAMDFDETDKLKCHMAASFSPSGTISFRQLSGLVRFTVYNVPASVGTSGYFRFRTNDKKTFGSFDVNMTDANPQMVAPDASGNQDFQLTIKSTPEDVVGKCYVATFPVPVGTYGYLRLSVQKSAGDMIGYKEKNSATTVTRGMLMQMPEITLNAVTLADNEDGVVRDNFNKQDYNNGYTGILTTDAQLSVQNNPVRTVANVSGKALKVTSTADGTRSGLTALLTKGAFDTDPVAYYPSGYRNGTKAFSVKMLYANPSDKSKYFPRAQCKSTQEVFGLPDRINGEAFDGTAAEWDRLVKAGDWNVLQWTCNTSDVYRIDLKPFLDFAGSNAASDSERVIYFDDFRLLK